MQSVIGDTFISRDGEITYSDVEKNQVVCLFFTAYWCPPCRTFTPVLVEFYNDVNYPDKRLEIIQISSDKDEQMFMDSFNQVPWIAIPYGDSRNISLRKRFKVQGVPILMLLNKDGTLAQGTGRADVQTEGPGCFDRWYNLVN
ncbi:unnamed protein product [Blepharisma stoltei]|uniref:protein-disulfide reductase n=1 Tax=Blepharisma stoltei TaxID=1481888 RepID=A0AAU9ILI3_9CILI|nr:unnamed protein product [Blepharisma stoltei]